jgi:ribulose-phosphate 3-epimerase
LEAWFNAGARRVVLHFESNKNIVEAIGLAKDLEFEVGLAIAPKTPIEKIAKLISDVDFVQCMGIRNVGYQGQVFEEETISRVAHLRELYPELVISVDGGVTLENASALIDAGADRLVVGSALFGSPDVEESLREF